MRYLLVLLLFLGGCSAAPAPGPEASPTAAAVPLTRGSGKILAGQGVDEVKLGMSQADVEKAIGPPAERDQNEFNKSQTMSLYKDRGLEVGYDDGVVAMLTCHADEDWKPYTGATAEGLWVGSSFDEVKKALGEPKEPLEQALKYNDRGLWFTFDKTGKTVETIRVMKPEGKTP